MPVPTSAVLAGLAIDKVGYDKVLRLVWPPSLGPPAASAVTIGVIAPLASAPARSRRHGLLSHDAQCLSALHRWPEGGVAFRLR